MLRFWAYLRDPLPDAGSEEYRIRRCVILYHLEDATLAVNKPRQGNTAELHGLILKRRRCTSGHATVSFSFRMTLSVNHKELAWTGCWP